MLAWFGKGPGKGKNKGNGKGKDGKRGGSKALAIIAVSMGTESMSAAKRTPT